MKILRNILILVLFVFVYAYTAIYTSMILLDNKTKEILDDYSNIYTNPKYEKAISIDDVKLVKQDISCGYAVIEMFAKWSKNEEITEKTLYDKYNSVVTSTGKSFEEEMNKQFTDYNTTMYKYLKNTELIDKVYDSLNKGIPVPFEWAAKCNDEWTLHYSLITGIDVKNDIITIANPYGYIEKISIKEFLDRTSFEAYKDMPLFLKLGFGFSFFEKNTIFIVDGVKGDSYE